MTTIEEPQGLAALADTITRLTPAQVAEYVRLNPSQADVVEAAIAYTRATREGVKYEGDPAGWVHTRLNEATWSGQRRILASVAEHRRTAVKSCHGVGKSWSAARAACWWLDVHPIGEAFVVTTAPTDPQVKAILWREIARAHKHGNLAGRITLDAKWKIGDELVAYGRKPADYDEDAFQGIHALYVLVILDEACGIPAQLWTAANALATNENSRILAIGNPDDPSAHFHKVCEPGSGWHVLQLSALESPNFTGETVPDKLAASLVGHAYVDETLKDCGGDVGNPIYRSKVLGEFTEDYAAGVVQASKLAACRREGQVWAPEDLLPVELGVDIGGSDDGDATVIRERRGRVAGRVWRVHSSESEVVAAEIKARIIETGAVTVKIDSIGIGWGVAGHLEEKRRSGEHQANIVKVNVGQAPQDSKRFPKLRDELWWVVGRGLTEVGGWDLSAIDDRTATDLAAPQWAPNASGQIKVEPKDETRKRLGRSPDDADALLLAFFMGSGQGAAFVEAWKSQAAPQVAGGVLAVAEVPVVVCSCRDKRWRDGVCMSCGQPTP